MLIVKTQRHIFIIVIKLYCTKMLGQYLWEEQAGIRVDTAGGEAIGGKWVA